MAGASGNVRAGRAFVEIMLDQSKLEKGLKTAQRKLNNFSKTLTTVGKNMTSMSAIAAAPIALATKTFSGFDDEMRMVKAVTSSTEREFKHLTETAEKLGRETSFTAKQVAEGMTAMGRMGFNAKEIETAIPAVLNLSRATGTELSAAAEIAANNMRVFGMESDKMSATADILTAAANGSAQALTDLAEGLKMAGPQAAAAKDNIVNVSGALGVLANMGIKGTLAGTALRKSYSQFAKTKVQTKLKSIGVATEDANGNLRAMPDIMADIAKYMNGLPTAERLSFAEEIFDLRGSLAGLQLGGNIRQLDEFIKRLKSVNGTAKQTAVEMDQGIGGAFRIFMSAIEGCQISIGRIIGEALTPYINRLSAVLNRVAEWCAAHKQLILMATKAIAGIGALGATLFTTGIAVKTMSISAGALSAVFTGLRTAVFTPIAAVKGLMSVFALLKSVMAGVKVAALSAWTSITTPAVLLGIALGTLVAVIWKLTGAWDICTSAMHNLGADFANTFSVFKEVIGETWEAIKTALSSGDLAGAAKVGLSALKVVWLSGILPLKTSWAGLKNFLNDSFTVTVYSILKLANNLWYGLLSGLKKIGNAISDAWNYIWDGIVGAFEKTILEIQKAWIRAKGIFDSKEEVNAKITAAETLYTEKKAERERVAVGNENRRAMERHALEDEWGTSNQAIDTAMTREVSENQQKYNEALSAAAAEIENSKAQWQFAMEEVRNQAQTKAVKVKAATEKAEKAQIGTQQAAKRAETVSGQSFGAWSAKELDAMLSGGAGNVQERTAKATEEIAVNTRENNKLIKRLKGGTSAVLTFS